MLAAAETVLLYIASVLPGGKLALAAIAGLGSTAVLLRCGRGYAFGAFAVSSAAALLLSAVKLPAAAYILFLGYYPIVKSSIERRVRTGLQLPVKLILLIAAEAALYALYTLVAGTLPITTVAVAALVSIPVFIAYDHGLSALIELYLQRMTKK